MGNFADEYRQFLISHTLNGKSASGGSEVNCRCFYCPDSHDPRHGHFYISIPQSPDEPSKYHCMKCHESGYVTHKTLLDWGIWDDQIATDLIEHNKHTKYLNKASRIAVNRLINPIAVDDQVSQIKLQYINDRLGLSLSYDDLARMKITLSLRELLRCNGIDRLTREENIVDQLNYNFIGFISIDNGFLNMRRVCDEGLVYKSIDKRYINYNIYGNFDTSHRFYTIPSQIDLLQGVVNLHIAEGPFDILSIYHNLRHGEPGIYSSVGGSNYLGVIMYMIETIGLPWVNVHLYPDNDNSDDRKIKYIYQQLKGINTPLYIHKNRYPGEKDFGVPLAKIDEYVYEMREY